MGLPRRISLRSRKYGDRSLEADDAISCRRPANAFDYLGLRSGDQNKLFLGDPNGETLRLVTLGRCCYPVFHAGVLVRRAAPRDKPACAARGTGSPSSWRRSRRTRAASRYATLVTKSKVVQQRGRGEH